MIKEKVLEALAYLGFKYEEVGENTYEFSYEGTRYLYMYNDNDEDFLSIVVYGVYELEDGDELKLYKLIDKVNGTMKYCKAYRIGNSLWLSYERELFGEEDFAQLISTIILHLDSTLYYTRKAIADADKPEDTGDGETGSDTESGETDGDDIEAADPEKEQ